MKATLVKKNDKVVGMYFGHVSEIERKEMESKGYEIEFRNYSQKDAEKWLKNRLKKEDSE